MRRILYNADLKQSILGHCWILIRGDFFIGTQSQVEKDGIESVSSRKPCSALGKLDCLYNSNAVSITTFYLAQSHRLACKYMEKIRGTSIRSDTIGGNEGSRCPLY